MISLGHVLSRPGRLPWVLFRFKRSALRLQDHRNGAGFRQLPVLLALAGMSWKRNLPM